MRPTKLKQLTAIAAIVIGTLVTTSPVWAISIQDEKKLGREFQKVMHRYFSLVEDPVISGYVERIGFKILDVIPSQPFDYKFYVVKEEVYNASAFPAGHIFINSGLMADLQSEDELAGILAHEIAHVVSRHISERIERSKKIDLATLAGMVAGIMIGAKTGEAAAAQALTIGSAAAGQTATLAYSRKNEAEADRLGIQYLTRAGYDPSGLLAALKRIRSQQWFGSEQIPTYMMTHPAIESRITWIDAWITAHPEETAKISQNRAQTHSDFNKINIRLKALYTDPNQASRYFKAALTRYPNDADLAYGYSLALDRVGDRTEAVAYLKRALTYNALDPYILSDLGRIYFLSGRFDEALRSLKGSLTLKDDNPIGLLYLGRTQMALGKFKDAAANFEALIENGGHYQQVYYFLGETYSKMNRSADSHYHLGIYHFKKSDYRNARFHLLRARKQLEDPVKRKIASERLKEIEKMLRKSSEKQG
jgi:predicted Zn-dependent protease